MPKLSTLRDGLIQRSGLELTPGFLLSGAQRTFFLETGAGEPLVLLHGAGGGAVMWSPIIGPLARQYRVIAPDILGFGESAKPRASYDKIFFSDWLQRFLDALQAPAVGLVGHSFGGAVAIQFTLDHSDRVSRLVLVGSGGLGFQPPMLNTLAALFWAHLFPSRRSVRRLMAHLFHASNQPTGDLEIDYMVGVLRSPGGNRVFKHGRSKPIRPFSPAALKSIQQPVFLIWGAEDRIAPVHMAEQSERIIPGAKLAVIAEAGHAPFYERPQAFNAVLLPFLNRYTVC